MKKVTLLTLAILTSLIAWAQTQDSSALSQKKRIVKMEFFSPLFGNTTFGYEQYLKDEISIETKIGIIGLGKNIVDQSGLFLKVGAKFKVSPKYIIKGRRAYHPLAGKYIKPEIIVNMHKYNPIFEYEGVEKKSKSAALILNYGKQSILGKILTLDWHLGLGYNIGDTNVYNFSHIAGDPGFPIALSGGLTLGILMK